MKKIEENLAKELIALNMCFAREIVFRENIVYL